MAGGKEASICGIPLDLRLRIFRHCEAYELCQLAGVTRTWKNEPNDDRQNCFGGKIQHHMRNYFARAFRLWKVLLRTDSNNEFPEASYGLKMKYKLWKRG